MLGEDVRTEGWAVPGSFVREEPRYESPLPGCWVTASLTSSTAADSSPLPTSVPVLVLQLPGHRAVLQLQHGVGQVPPVRPGAGRHQLDPLLDERRELLAAVIPHLLTPDSLSSSAWLSFPNT